MLHRARKLVLSGQQGRFRANFCRAPCLAFPRSASRRDFFNGLPAPRCYRTGMIRSLEFLSSKSGQSQSVRRWRVLRRLFGAGSLLYVLSRFVPCGPTVYFEAIEGSWIQVLHVAFVEKWQFGRDIIFTYGPWGFLYGGFHPATHLISVVVWTILSVIFWCAAWRSARLCLDNEWLAGLWFVAFGAVAGLTILMNMDARLLAWILLLLLLHFFTDDRPFSSVQVSLVISLGLLCFIKCSFFPAASLTILVIAADNVWRQRRFPWILIVFGASLLLFWGLAGQQLRSLAPFLDNSWRIGSGYTEAMSLTRATEIRDICLYLGATALLGAMAGYGAWRRLRWFGILPLVGLVFVGFTAFKSGYVRHDTHEAWATIQLLLGALTCQAIAWQLAQKKRWVLVSSFVPTLLILLLASVNLARHTESRLVPALMQTFGIRNLISPLALFHDRGRLLEADEGYLAYLRDRFPLPPIEGSVDAYPWNQYAIFAHGLRYHPRPVIHSYSAYTPELAELNAAHLRSTNAPDNILFDIRPIDNHYPALEDGSSWPELLTQYDIKSTNGPFLLLARSPTPRKYQKTLLTEAPISFGQTVVLSAFNDGPVWAEIEIDKSLLGTAISTLYKPPHLLLTVSIRDGREGSFRLIPGMARGGFLLSPLIHDRSSFVQLASRDGSSALANLRVDSVAISAATKFGETACYGSPTRIRLYRLEYPRQDL